MFTGKTISGYFYTIVIVVFIHSLNQEKLEFPAAALKIKKNAHFMSRILWSSVLPLPCGCTEEESLTVRPSSALSPALQSIQGHKWILKYTVATVHGCTVS